MENEILWRKNEEDYEVEKRWTLKEIGIGLIAGGLYLLAVGLVVYVVIIA